MENFNTSKTQGLPKTGYEFLTRTYGWMFLALIISAVAAYAGSHVYAVAKFVWGTRYTIFVLCGLELALVIGLTAAIRKISVSAAVIGFLAYSLINGLTISSIFLIYSVQSIFLAFMSTAIMFGLMSIYGITTKKNLATAGHYLMMALLGLIVVSVVNAIVSIFVGRLGMLDWILSLATVVIFTGLTAYDAQKVAMLSVHDNGSEDFKKVSIFAALNLYLDFINIFLSLLRLFGRSK